jgi:hypothetical protein
LSYCAFKLRELPKKQWLDENVLAHTRLICCIYGVFFNSFKVPDAHAKTASSLQQLLNALHVMIFTLMSPQCTYSDSKKLDLYIKFFLSCCQRANKLVNGPNSDEWWAEKGNMNSLLNLTERIEKFGPVR